MQRSIPDKQGNENKFFLLIFAFGFVLLSSVCLSFIMIFQFFTFSTVAMEMKNKIETVPPQPTPFGVFWYFPYLASGLALCPFMAVVRKNKMAAIGDDFSTFLVKFPVKSNGQFTEKQYFGAQKLVNQQGTFQRLKTRKLEFASKLVSLVVLSQVRVLNRYWVSYSKYCWKSAIW